MATAALLRLWLPWTIEFKADEQEALNLGMRLLDERPWSSANPWPRHGMLSSHGVGNAPLFSWIMALVWTLTHHPVGATAVIALVNAVSLYPLWLWTKRRCGDATALLTLAVMAVSPFAVLFSRKLWAQDLLLPGLVVLLWGVEWLRERPWRGVTLLAVAALLVGQLHQSGAIAMALLPLAIGVQVVADRWRDGQWPRLGKPSRREALALVAVLGLNAFFWIPYASYLFSVPTETFVHRPKMSSYSLSLLAELEDQLVPRDLFYFFDRDDFMRDEVRRWLYQASCVFGAPLLVYGVWRWLRAPLRIPVVGIWWWMIVVAFTLARIPTYPFYVLVLAPLPALLAAGAFDGKRTRDWLAATLALWRWTYVSLLACLTVATYLWVARRGDGGGDFGVTFAVREAQARALLAIGNSAPAAIQGPVDGTAVADGDLGCQPLPIEVRWIVRSLDAHANPPDTLRICDGFRREPTQRYYWTIRTVGER